MITMSNLGKNGRLGNQIFQFAFLYGLHKLKGYDYCIPPNTDLLNCFNINCKIQNNLILPKKFESGFGFDKSYPLNYKDKLDYKGYFQTEKYFKHCKRDLIQTLQFKELHKKTLPEQNLISIHVRRGDYVGNAHHPVVSLEYINQAKLYFQNKKFIVFSDDINWCKEQNIGDYYAENINHYTDLYQMTQCSGSIIANSSFSWWGAYLTPKEKVVAPKHWFSGAGTSLNTVDLYCENWIII